jgi:hypothetical protein
LSRRKRRLFFVNYKRQRGFLPGNYVGSSSSATLDSAHMPGDAGLV